MTEREKLIELLKQDNCPSPMFCSDNCKYVNSSDCAAERFADHLLENGVIVLPVKVGDTVYVKAIENFDIIKLKYKIITARVTKFIFDEFICSFWANSLDGNHCYKIDINDIGKTVFLTKEEAEQALRKEDKGK